MMRYSLTVTRSSLTLARSKCRGVDSSRIRPERSAGRWVQFSWQGEEKRVKSVLTQWKGTSEDDQRDCERHGGVRIEPLGGVQLPKENCYDDHPNIFGVASYCM